jgi:hypothetical protein
LFEQRALAAILLLVLYLNIVLGKNPDGFLVCTTVLPDVVVKLCQLPSESYIINPYNLIPFVPARN